MDTPREYEDVVNSRSIISVFLRLFLRSAPTTVYWYFASQIKKRNEVPR